MLDRSSASLAALPGEASPTRACLGAIAGQGRLDAMLFAPKEIVRGSDIVRWNY